MQKEGSLKLQELLRMEEEMITKILLENLTPII